MRLSRRKMTHVRFEPNVDRGTTYAFEYKAGKLVIGRERMHRLILEIPSGGRDLEELVDRLVDPRARGGAAYPDKGELLADVMRLVEADVLEVTRDPGRP
jgi:hypothetical protein